MNANHSCRCTRGCVQSISPDQDAATLMIRLSQDQLLVAQSTPEQVEAQALKPGSVVVLTPSGRLLHRANHPVFDASPSVGTPQP